MKIIKKLNRNERLASSLDYNVAKQWWNLQDAHDMRKMYKINSNNSKSSILGVTFEELVFDLGYDNITQQWRIYKMHAKISENV